MAVLLYKDTAVAVQGITGYQGSFHTKKMLEYGTNIVAGITPGKGGTQVHGVPVYDTMEEAMYNHHIDASIIFVPAPFVLNAALEAIHSGVKLLVIITEGVPVWDTAKIAMEAEDYGVTLIGPNCPGIITPGQAKMGIIPGNIVKPGKVGVVSRSGTLTYEVIQQLTSAGIGQSTCIGIGGDPVHGIGFIEALEFFENDPNTEKIVMIGEIGGDAEEEAAEFIYENISKPVVSFIAGQTAPPGKQMGHAGAIIMGEKGTAKAKIEALESVGVKVVKQISEIPGLLKD